MKPNLKNVHQIATVAAIALASLLQDASARTWHILPDGHGDVATIQAAIDVAAAGDTVLVAPGRYYANLHFRGRDIVLTSEAGPEATILDGSQQDSAVVVIGQHETRACVLDGFTITNGHGATLRTSLIRSGGGVFINDASPIVQNNHITGNVAPHTGFGGGIEVLRVFVSGAPARPLIQHNIVSENDAGYDGGGVGADGTVAPEIIDNIIQNNTTLGDGGGVWVISFSNGTVIADNRVTDNVAGDHGGGIYCGSSEITLHEFSITGNLVAGNAASGTARTGDSGGGVWLAQVTGSVLGNTVVKNEGGGPGNSYGGGIVFVYESTPVVERNIIGLSVAGGGLLCHQTTIPVMRNNLVWANAGGDGVGNCTEWFIGNGNIQADPRFCNAVAGDYSLPPNSPAMTHPAGPLGAITVPGCTNGVPIIATTWSAIKLLFH